jgi:flavin-dependent dehydrogenase
MAGLCASAALRGAFDEVVILEKDPVLAETTSRKGVPQGAHLHSLLVGAQVMLEELFPGLKADLLAAGAAELRAGLDQQVFEAGAWMPERDLGYTILAQSRGMLEREVRHRVEALPGIRFVPGAKVTELVSADTEQARVSFTVAGVSEALVADAVVDATGVSAALVRHLDCEIPQDEVASGVSYVSGFLQKPAGLNRPPENILIVPEPSQSSGGALLDVEGGLWVVSLHGRRGKKPPLEFEGWRQFAQSLPDQRIWERVKDAELAGEKLTPFNKPVSTFRRFDRARGIPPFYFPIGDVITSVNPIFGQGMAVLAGHAHALKAAFAESAESRNRRYIEAACAWSERAWRRAYAYDRTFLPGVSEGSAAALGALARSRLEGVRRDAGLHRAMFVESQMLPSWAGS